MAPCWVTSGSSAKIAIIGRRSAGNVSLNVSVEFTGDMKPLELIYSIQT